MFNINHISISVINNKESIEFYKKFGFKEFKKWEAKKKINFEKNKKITYFYLTHTIIVKNWKMLKKITLYYRI